MSRTCGVCKKVLDISNFSLGKDEEYKKTCENCLEKKREYRRNHKCPHGKEKNDCKDCGGGSICEHGKTKRICKICKGDGICEHDRQKSNCIECKGTNICEHNRRRAYCKDCKGSQICEHNRQRGGCKDCKGSQICEHDKKRSKCKQCKGSEICIHGSFKSICRTCDYPKNPHRWCHNCTFTRIHPATTTFYPYCFTCYCYLHPDEDIPKKYKIREHHVRDAVKEHFPDVTMVFDKIIDGGCSKKRPDILIDRLTHSVIIECDEDQHVDYSCENKRSMTIFQDLGQRPLVLIRFNPDKYKQGEDVIDGCFKLTKTAGLSLIKKEWNKRISVLVDMVKEAINNVPQKEYIEKRLFYDS